MFLNNNAFQFLKKRCGFALLAAVLALSFMCFTATLKPAQAQQGSSTLQLRLTGQTETYSIGPYIKYFKDLQGGFSVAQIRNIFENTNLPATLSTDLVRLSDDNVHWLYFEISNQTRNESWVLSFGNQFSGRLGAPDEIAIYDTVSGQTILDMRESDETGQMNTYKGNLIGNSVPLPMERGQKAAILMRVVSHSHTPLIFPVDLKSTSIHTKHRYSLLSDANLPGYLFIICFAFYAALFLVRRDALLGLFVVFAALQCGAYSVQNYVFYSGLTHSIDTKLILLTLMAVCSLFMTRLFLKFDKDDVAQHRIILLAALYALIIVPAGLWAFPQGSAIGLMLSLSPLILLPILMFLFSLGAIQNRVYGVSAYIAGCFAGMTGNIMTVFAILNFIPVTELGIYALWFGLLTQNAMFICALMVRHIQEERDRQLMLGEEQENLKTVKDINRSRVGAENKRLLKLIKHEREVMNELREREIEQNTETRKAREAAEEANRAKSAFLAVISHEIRTPMTGVLGMARLLIQEQLTKKQKEYATTIKDSGEAMVSLLNDILDFEKIESNNLDLEETDFDLVRLLNGVITLMSGHANAKNITLDSEIDPSLPQAIIGDSVRLRQILLNLVGNAIKFTDQGRVTLVVKKQNDAEHKGSDRQKIMFAVRDTGIGISPEAQKNLFNPFSQADSSITRKFGGTGLGLAISQRLVEAMGAKIEIESTEGEGSTFFFNLSMKTGSAEKAEETDALASRKKQSKQPEKVMSVLVVEDNEVNRKLLKELLDRIGHKVQAVTTGEEGVKAVKEGAFDVVLMDVHLPGISGMGATKAIRALDDMQKASIPVIALTGNTANEDIRACYAANMNGHIAKPVEPDILEKMLERAGNNDFDNPVELPEDRPRKRDDAKPAEKQQTETKTETKESDEERPAEKSYNPLDVPAAPEEKPEQPEAGKKPDDENMSPLRAMAAGLEDFNFDEDDLDLEEDSFASAIEMSEESVDEKPEKGADQALDSSVIDGLRNSIGYDMLENMITEMFMKFDELLQTLTKAAHEGDKKAFLDRAHELKGMSANFGLNQIRSTILKAEASHRAGEEINLKEIVKELVAAEKDAKSALRQWVGASGKLHDEAADTVES